MTRHDRPTPAALIDEARLMHNITRMHQRMGALGVGLRPHVKTARCLKVARRQREAGAQGITVSTLKEAEQFSWPALTASTARCAFGRPSGCRRALRERGSRLRVVVDSQCHTPAALQAMAEQERSRCVRAFERLRAAGLPCPVVSVGSTPTALTAVHLDGVTEVRAGVHVFQNLVLRSVGVATHNELALSVLTTVIGRQIDKGWTLVDAGWMAMGRDRGTQAQPVD